MGTSDERMVEVVFHEHPRQAGECLRGAFAEYVSRIGVPAGVSLADLWQRIRKLPYLADRGGLWDQSIVASCSPPLARGTARADNRCSPAQRSRVWPETMNCWEASAHFVAGARQLLVKGWVVHVWDRDLPNGARHLWPSLITPEGDHLLVVLQSVVPRQYPPRLHTGTFPGGRRQ